MSATLNLKDNLKRILDGLDSRLTKLEQSRFFRAPVIVGSPALISNGDIWVDSTNNQVHIRVNGVTKTFTVT